MSTTEATAESGQVVTENDEREAFVKGLRDLADFIEETGAVVPYASETMPYTINTSVETRDELAVFARLAGNVTKDYSEAFMALRKQFGPVAYDVFAAREAVCRRVQVGTTSVTKEVPDPEKLAEIPVVTVTEVEPVFEWRCDEPILIADAQRAAAHDDPRGERDR